MAFKDLCDEAKELLRQRASNYDGTSAEDLYDLLPDNIKGNSKAIILFMKGCPELGIEPAEVMHIQSEANGGSDDPSNLMWGPRSINRRIGSDNMTPADIEEVNEANQENIKTILDNIDIAEVPTDCDDECPDSDELHEFLPRSEEDIPVIEESLLELIDTESVMELITDTADAVLRSIPLIGIAFSGSRALLAHVGNSYAPIELRHELAMLVASKPKIWQPALRKDYKRRLIEIKAKLKEWYIQEKGLRYTKGVVIEKDVIEHTVQITWNNKPTSIYCKKELSQSFKRLEEGSIVDVVLNPADRVCGVMRGLILKIH